MTYANTGQNLEPEKCKGWSWVPWSQMWEWAKEQAEAEDSGQEVKKRYMTEQ
jgi:8-oxo-dGTP diphosphatase